MSENKQFFETITKVRAGAFLPPVINYALPSVRSSARSGALRPMRPCRPRSRAVLYEC